MVTYWFLGARWSCRSRGHDGLVREWQMEKQTLGNALLLILIGAAAVVAGLYYYNNYIEPQNDGPMERAGEKIDDALDGKK
jgi:hypothetical protein